MPCRQNLLKPDGSCRLWSLYNEGFKPVMCETIRKEKGCDAWILSFLRPKVKPEQHKKLEEIRQDMETLNKGMLAIMLWRELHETKNLQSL